MARAKNLGIIVVVLYLMVLVSAFFVGYLFGERQGSGDGKTSDGSAMKGSQNAPVTLILWSDFQCPFSGRFAQQTLPQIESSYVATGKVKLVFKDYPLGFHPFAQKAAEAGKCALEQGKFWELHDKIFANQAQLSLDNLKLWAAQSGVNVAKFNECLDSGRMAPIVAAEMAEGQGKGITGTPGFIVVSASGEQRISGAQPFSEFQKAIDAALAG